MVEAKGTDMEEVAAQLVGNTAGIVMRDDIAEQLAITTATPSAIAVRTVIEAVAAGTIAMGYTNPFASSTSLNFLQTTLRIYAEGDETRMLDEDVASAFEAFQKGVPILALTTMQLRNAVGDGNDDGPLDALVMERQTFTAKPELANGWTYIPYGVRHDNPLWARSDAEPDAKAVLAMFAKYATSRDNHALAQKYGFFGDPQYSANADAPSGNTLIGAQRLWKKRKDAGRPVIAMFVVDVSGSMAGSAIAQARRALMAGAENISRTNAVGLIAFNSEVSIRLPVEKFTTNHRGRFMAAAKTLEAGGGTAMYSAVAVALNELVKARSGAYENARARLLVLSDGESLGGLSLGNITAAVHGLGIPIYTISYGDGADDKTLRRLSSLVEAEMLKADEGAIAKTIRDLMNTQL